ncbi:MAG TPA: hypothetical protein VFL67_01605 [Mycobacterium sp.]|nr:hypothetical protein [Mycobacterium sp.]
MPAITSATAPDARVYVRALPGSAGGMIRSKKVGATKCITPAAANIPASRHAGPWVLPEGQEHGEAKVITAVTLLTSRRAGLAVDCQRAAISPDFPA